MMSTKLDTHVKHQSHTIYYENWILKKEGARTWESYYGRIRGKWLQFYERVGSTEKIELRKTLELPSKTQCSLVKRTKRRYPLAINNGISIYYIKCESEIERYHWIFSILSAALGKDKKPLPETIPEVMRETTAFKKESRDPVTDSSSSQNGNSTSTSPTKRIASASDFKNKRRQKYAIRNENRMKRKAAKRARELGLDPNKIQRDNEEEEKKEDKEERAYQSEKDLAVLRRTKNIRQITHNNDENLVMRIRSFSETSLPESENHKTCKEQKELNSSTNVTALMNPKAQKKVLSGDRNHGFEEEDANRVLSVPVQLLNTSDESLPNAVVYYDDDGDSDGDTTDTASTSISSSILSQSGTSSPFLLSVNSPNYTPKTFPSADCKFEEKNTKAETISSPLRQQLNITNSRSNSPSSGRLLSNYRNENISKGLNDKCRSITSSLLIPNSLMDRPLTPAHARPLSPNRSPKHFSRFLVDDQTSLA